MNGSNNSDGIAVIGMSCRFPGAGNADEFWDNLRNGVESVTFFSDQELRDSGVDPILLTNPNYVKAGCVIENIDLFDARFFGYSPREAETIDPQQRLFLECAWEAIEDAGYFPQTYEGLIGVFGGTRLSSYQNGSDSDLSPIGTALSFQALTGNDKDYLTTRVSYKLNLRGPSVAVQSACSTSLVAVHMACESLRNGECDMALAGGTAISVPQKQGYLFQEGMIFSPDGHCRAFDAEARGMIGGNGVGIVMLKRLSDALADGDNVYAVIKGSAVNNDGWAKVGYTAPSLEGQVAVISEALAMADIAAETISYIEAHGTGTVLGDPMEIEALTRVFRSNTNKNGFCAIGSVKTNFGHLDTVAGVASLIKTVLALENQQLPPSLHFNKPNPRIDFSNTPFFVNTKLSAWKANGNPRRAGVSSFGIGGTNAHVVMEEAPESPPSKEAVEHERPLHLMTLSAFSKDVLKQFARRYLNFLEDHPETSVADICFTTNAGRSYFPHRLAIPAGSTETLQKGIKSFITDRKSADLITGYAPKDSIPKLAFLFTGQGSQYQNMGRALYNGQPVFRRALNRCDEILYSHLDRPLLRLMFQGGKDVSCLDQTAYAQPALFALEYALSEMWRSWGIEPSAVMGHSVGEYVAACVSGVFSLEDALKLVSARGRLIQALPQNGDMAAVFAGEKRVRAALAGQADEVAIAAINGPENVVISGARTNVNRILNKLALEGIRSTRLNVSHPFHSPFMAPILSDFEAIAAEVAYLNPNLDMISNVTGRLAKQNEVCGADYWRRHLSEPVQFASGMETLHEQGITVFLELGPAPVLLGMGRKCVPAEGSVWLPSLRKGQDEWRQIVESMGKLYVHGVKVNWRGFERNYTRRRVSLPTYPFERKSYWAYKSTEIVEKATPAGRTIPAAKSHPLLGKRIFSALPIYEIQLDCNSMPFLERHRMNGMMMVPAGVFFEIAFASGREFFGTSNIILTDVAFHEVLILPGEKSTQTIQLILTPASRSEVLVKLFSWTTAAEEGENSWNLNISGRLHVKRMNGSSPSNESVSFDKLHAGCFKELSSAVCFSGLRDRGLLLDEQTELTGIRAIRIGSGEAMGDLLFEDGQISEAINYQIHPSIMDPCLQVLWAATLMNESVPSVIDNVYLPVGIERVRYYTDAPEQLWCYSAVRPGESWCEASFGADFYLFDSGGRVVAEIMGVRIRRINRKQWLRSLQNPAENLYYGVKWQPMPMAAPVESQKAMERNGSGFWIIFADQGGVGKALRRFLEERGETCITVNSREGKALSIEPGNAREYRIDPANSRDFIRLFQQILADRSPICRGIVHLWSLDTPPSDQLTTGALTKAHVLSCGSVLHLLQGIAGFEWAEPPRLCLVTRGAQSVNPAATVLNVAQAPLWGLAKSISREHFELNQLIVDLDPVNNTDDIQLLWGEIRRVHNEPEVSFRGGERHVPRLVPMSEAPNDKASPNIRSDGTYLITGGLGGMGLEVAKWVVAQGGRYLTLIGRSRASDTAMENLNRLKKNGAHIMLRQCDISDQCWLTAVFNEIKSFFPPIRGIFHLAGVPQKGALIRQNLEYLASVMAPKVEGAWNLHLLARALPLDFFVLFSSISSLLGGRGLGGYAAANSFMDALGVYGSIKDIPALSINWGAFSEVGMIANDKEGERIRSELGINSIPPKQVLSNLKMVMGQKSGQICVINMDWHRFFSNYPGDAPPFLSIIHSNIVTQKDDKPISVESASILYRLRYASREMRWTLIEEYLKEIIAQELRLDIEQIGEDADLIQLGMDSLIFLNIAHVLAKELRIKLTAQEIFETSSISAMARCVEEKIESLPDSGEADLAVISKTTITPDPAGRHLPFDLTDIQQAYWVGRSGELELGNVGCHTYFETDSDELDIERYTAAWRRLIDRHDMLRVVFLPNGQQRIIEKVPPYEIKFLDLKDAPPEIAELKLKTIREKMSHQVLKTSEWPLFEVRATRMATGKIRIHVSLDLLIADVDSLLVLMKELAELYNNPDMFHDPLELSFRDYVMAEAGLRESDLYKRSEAYWMKRLPSIPQAPELPLATNPRHIVKPRFTRRTFRLSPETWSLLKNRASEAGLTASGILICAYAEVLSHWSKSPRFTINLTLFNRLDLHPQISRIVGDFTSVTLLETFEFPDLSFKERAQALQKRLWNDMEHRYFSGIRVLRALGQNGKTHLGASMPVVFTSNIRSGFNSTDHSPVTTVGEMVYSISQTPQVWLDSQVMEEVGELKVWWDTVEDLFPRGLVGEMFNAYHGLLMELAENIYAWREKRPYRLSGKLLERRLAVNNTAARISPEMLHTLFTMRAAERGEKTAVICSDRTLCYRELSNRSNQLAFILRERGALPNTLVAVVMEKGWEQVVAVLSVLLSGAAYLPIEPSVPEERRMHILQNGDVRFVLTQSALKSDLKWPETVECFSVDEMEPKEGEFRAPEPIQTPEDLAYVIYTSGSTGLSKGVMIDHRGAVNTILDVNNRFSMGNEDRVLALSSLSFDLSVFDIFGVLAAGGAIVMPENRRRKDPAHWLDLIIRERITVWNSVPTLMQMLVEYIKDRQEVLPPTLRLLLLSGDWIPMDLPDRVKALFKGIEVVSLGGATEASIWSILYPIESIDPQWKSIPYGRPMRNQRFYVLNEFMEACPDWVTGQLYIGGIGLAKGYWRDEEKTVASFVSHPDTGERLYRTGDLGCFWPDGNIEFMGREDFQVKISGYRIELGEIEASLRLHPSVRDAVVVAAGNQTGGRYLLGYVEAVDGEKIEPDCLKNFLRKKLADYMIPRDVMILDRLPLTPNGKIDRVALPLPKRIFLKSEHQSTAPQNKMEEMIAGVVREVLDVDGADVHDKFFNLGADSLKITVMRNKLSKLSGQDISVLSLFEHPTISDLAQFINCETGRCDSFDRVHKRTESRKKAARKRRRF